MVWMLPALWLAGCSRGPVAPPVVNVWSAPVSLGTPEGATDVDLAAFLVDDDDAWILVGTAWFGENGDRDQRWITRVVQGVVEHQLHGPGWFLGADLAPDGTVWTVGMVDGKPRITAFDRDGELRCETSPPPSSTGELTSVRATAQGAVALGLDVPAVPGRGDPWWVEVDARCGVVATATEPSVGYGYATGLDVEDGHALAVGRLEWRSSAWTREGDRLSRREVLGEALQDLTLVERVDGGWLVVGVASGRAPPLNAGLLVLARLPDDGEPTILATSRAPTFGSPSGLAVVDDDVWIVVPRLGSDRFDGLEHRTYRLRAGTLEVVRGYNPGFGALGTRRAGDLWVAWDDQGAVYAERLSY